MRAVRFHTFGGELELADVPEPELPDHGAVIDVHATGLCRSDWHGWKGHDKDVTLPHVPGHEFAGVVVAVGPLVRRWHAGERVTAPFVCGCGTCPSCADGDQQVCENQTQPGFTHEGSFAERVVVHHADVNLVRLPAELDMVAAAALGCRFATAYRAVAQRGRPMPGDWVAVHGCGGVGLSAIMVAVAAGARVVAVDVSAAALVMAATLGAEVCLDVSHPSEGDLAATAERVGLAVRDATGGGARLSIDALGSPATCAGSVHSLRRRGRHVQVGLLPPALGLPPLPMTQVIAQELEILGSHGMAAHSYPGMLAAVVAGTLRPDQLVTRRIGLDEVPVALAAMSAPPTAAGLTVATLVG
jgi:alcohol dehydrogenase